MFLFSLLLLFASVANAQTSLSVKVYGLGETANKYGIKGRKVERNSLEDIKKVLKEYNIGE